MAQVFNNRMVSHVWANQSQTEGRSHNGQFYFEGPNLFSYGRHYIAGYILPMPDGGRVFMVNDDSRSITTSRHVSYAAQAIPGRALRVPGLTEWAETMAAATTRYDWGAAEAQEAAGTWPRGLPCGHVMKSAKERRAFLPELRARFDRFPFPGEEAAAAMFRALGDSNPERAAATQARKAAKREEEARARRDKQERDALARGAKHDAQKSPRDISRGITERLGAHSNSEHAAQRLADWGREINREAKEAKARGWNRIAAILRAHYRAIRDAVKDSDKRSRAAYRNRNRRRSIQRFRDAARSVTRFEEARAAGEAVATLGSPAGLARLYEETAAACGDLSRHIALKDSTLARLATLQEEARAKAAAWQEEARAEWLSGGHGRARLSDTRGGALLRAVKVERDDSGAIIGGDLQTSHGASVPLPHALRVFRFLKHCRATGQDWAANGRKLRVGHFSVDSVTPSGDFVAGCHRINWQEVERLARALGVESLAPEDTTAA